MSEQTLRYEKLANELEGMIAGGILTHGERLPSVRRLSQERRLSVSTVVQALRQLEDRGLVEARPQSGYFVRRPMPVRGEPVTRSTPVAPMPVDISATPVPSRSTLPLIRVSFVLRSTLATRAMFTSAPRSTAAMF